MEPVNINLMIGELVTEYHHQMAMKNIKFIPVLLSLDCVSYEWGECGRRRLVVLRVNLGGVV